MTEKHALRQRLGALGVKAARLEGICQADTSRHAAIVADVSLAKGRTALGEEISRVFDSLQERAHQRSVGAFERLLSAILADVVPDQGTVRLIPQFKSSDTWLDIKLEKEGELEDLLEGNGGAVTNVVCAGLRFAALTRTTNRRLMVLDEADCWIKGDRIPDFIRVIADVSTQTRTQTFFISHHDASNFEGKVNIVKLVAGSDGNVSASALMPLAADWGNDTDPGIRAIELVNVRTHRHTTIPCFPGATAFIGDNNLGKSTAIVNTFKAVAYGESDDSIIRHGCEEAVITFHLENNSKIEWSRSKKRSPAVIYSYWKDGVKVEAGPQKARNQAPAWVEKILGISRVDDLDIQIGHQKSPVFLLNDSAPKRAKILSVGKEAGHLRTLMKKYDEIKSSDRETIKQGERELTALKGRIAEWEKLPSTLSDIEAAQKCVVTVIETSEKSEQLDSLIAKLTSIQKTVNRLERESIALSTLPAELPVLFDLQRLSALSTKMERHAVVSKLPEPLALPLIPVLTDVVSSAAPGNLAERMHRASRLAALSDAPSLPLIPVVNDLKQLQNTGRVIAVSKKLLESVEGVEVLFPAEPIIVDTVKTVTALNAIHANNSQIVKLDAELVLIQEDYVATEGAIMKIKADLGDCPVCGSVFDCKEGVGHEH